MSRQLSPYAQYLASKKTLDARSREAHVLAWPRRDVAAFGLERRAQRPGRPR
jgi:hypothetical protein